MSAADFWNQRFAHHTYQYGTQPNAFLVEQAACIPPGARVLVPGDGEGRNGVWLAEQGMQVTSVDCSCAGLDKARALAAQRGVVLDTVQADLAQWVPPAGCADAVAMLYLHLSPELRPHVMRNLVHALRPEGVLLVEAFHTRQLGLPSGGPGDAAMLYTLDMLRSDVQHCGVGGQELLAWEGSVVLDEGPCHQGPAQVVRWIWRKAA